MKVALLQSIQKQISVMKVRPYGRNLTKDALMGRLSELEECLDELEEHDCQFERYSKVVNSPCRIVVR
jgi:hypothetical protein